MYKRNCRNVHVSSFSQGLFSVLLEVDDCSCSCVSMQVQSMRSWTGKIGDLRDGRG